MFQNKHLNSFNIYIVFLIFTSCILINGFPRIPNFNIIIYLFIHILLIYLIIYYYRLLLYFIYFIVGFIFDIFLLNEIGPHIITFMILILILRKLQRFMILLNPKNIFFLILIILFSSISFEMLISFVLFNYLFDISYLIRSVITSLLISYPIFYLFSKIDKFG